MIFVIAPSMFHFLKGGTRKLIFNCTQRMSPIVPSEWVGGYPANGYDATQPLGTVLPNRWV